MGGGVKCGWARLQDQQEVRARYLPSVLWAWLQRDGTREVERNLKEHSTSSITF